MFIANNISFICCDIYLQKMKSMLLCGVLLVVVIESIFSSETDSKHKNWFEFYTCMK